MSGSDDQAGRLSMERSSGPSLSKKQPSQSKQGHRKLVFADPVAFRYLEEDPATVVLERRERLQGYEIYLVEQWACSRIHPTFIIATYTGDSSHSISVGVLSVPKDESTWSGRLKVYFKAMSEYYAREKETPLGNLMVTNLSGFPSSLTVIAVPDGDFRKHREDFVVNENLKRLGCAGRAALNLQNPQPSTIAKFHHLYRTSESVPLYTSVMELVKICQVSLLLYGKLAPAYADGLLCDITEKAINDWWSDIGAYIYNIEPNDGILGPSTVSALVGLLMGAFNRMKAFGAPVGKDVFDVSSTKRAIGYFQKARGIERTRRLDRQTLMKLHKVTAKTASGEGWTVPKAVKSTVAELSGKGGEMVMGIVGGREKAGIAEVETLDMDRLAHLVTGTKARWLWQGKGARSNEADPLGSFGPSGDDKIFSTDDQGNYIWTSKHRDSVWTEGPMRRTEHPDDPETRMGFGRFKDAVGIPGLRSHQPKHSKDHPRAEADDTRDIISQRGERASKSSQNNQSTKIHTQEQLPTVQNSTFEAPSLDAASSVDHNTSQIDFHGESGLSHQASQYLLPEPEVTAHDLDFGAESRQGKLEEVKRDLSSDNYRCFFPNEQNQQPQVLGLAKTQSFVKTVDVRPENPRINRLPRYLSFSAIDNVVLRWDDIAQDTGSKNNEGQKPYQALLEQRANATLAQEKGEKISYLERVTIPFTERQVSEIEALDQLHQKQHEELNAFYYERMEDYQTQKATSTDIIADERQDLNEGLRKVEMLGAKLDYELNVLNSRVEEVESGVAEFERTVVHIESRVAELVDDGSHRESWWLYLRQFFNSRKS